MSNRVLPLAVTSGDPAGVGFDVTLVAWHQRDANPLPPFYLMADPEAVARRAETLGLDVSIAVTTPERAGDVFAGALPVVDINSRMRAIAGKPDTRDAIATIASIEQGVADIQGGLARAVVTNPISKHVLYEAGFRHPGHTEFLGQLALAWGPGPYDGVYRPIMMLAGPELRTVPVTVHISLADAARDLTEDLIVTTGEIVAHDLKLRFGIDRPRLAISGLNPHAGEAGSMGREEIEIIAPAIATLATRGIDAFGPLPADTLFHASARSAYDAALCMYHDQALIPVKTLAFDETVNVTLGLPFVRTSPDHGTAFDIAGSGRARAGSFIAALQLADRLTRVADTAVAG